MLCNLSKLKNLARELASYLEVPTLITLNGELGAGKTQFSKFFLESLGFTRVASPTYALMHLYKLENSIRSYELIYHADLYRIKQVEEVFDLDFMYEPAIVLVEWADKVPQLVWERHFSHIININFKVVGIDTRALTLSSYPQDYVENYLEKLQSLPTSMNQEEYVAEESIESNMKDDFLPDTSPPKAHGGVGNIG